MNENFDWAKNLNKLIDHINNSQHRITGFTLKEIQTAFKNNDKVVLDEAFDTELKKKKPNVSREVFEVDEIYEIEKVFKPKKYYSVYEYKLDAFKDRFKEEELLKIVGNPQNKIIKVHKFVISKLVKPVIQDDEVYYEQENR